MLRAIERESHCYGRGKGRWLQVAGVQTDKGRNGRRDTMFGKLKLRGKNKWRKEGCGV